MTTDFDFLSVQAQPKQQWEQFIEQESYLSLMNLRHQYTTELGFAILTQELVQELAKICEGCTVLDAGAGSGYLSYNLSKQGIDVLAVDNRSSHSFARSKEILKQTPFILGNAIDSVQDHDVILLSWPPYEDSFAADVLKKMKKGQTLLYLGEGEGGCTGDDQFFSILDQFDLDRELSRRLNSQHYSWHAIYDRWTVARPGV